MGSPERRGNSSSKGHREAQVSSALLLCHHLGSYSGEGNGNPLQYSYLENLMGRAAWRATQTPFHGVSKSHTWLNDLTHTHTGSCCSCGWNNISILQPREGTVGKRKWRVNSFSLKMWPASCILPPAHISLAHSPQSHLTAEEQDERPCTRIKLVGFCGWKEVQESGSLGVIISLPNAGPGNIFLPFKF